MLRFKKQVLSFIVGSAVCLNLFQPSVIFAKPKATDAPIQKEAVFLGVDGYATKTPNEILEDIFQTASK